MNGWLHDPQVDGDFGLEQGGGKAWALQRLAQAGVITPRYIVVTAQAFDAAKEGRFPEGLEDALLASLRRAGLDACPLAVRSSALAEDGARSSYAGQFETVLGARLDEVPKAVLHVWASARSERVEAYRRQQGDPPPRMAVIVQALVDAEASGVVFSADPLSRRGGRCLINAVWGLGEGLVSGELNADTWVVEGGRASVQAVEKPRALRRRPDGGTAYEALDPQRSAAPCLSPEQALALAALARRLENRFGAPQDIEWALDAQGRLCILQSRPISTLAGRLRLWDNSNIVESYAGVTTPLTFSFARSVYEEAYVVVSRMLGVPQRLIDAHRDIFSQRLALIRGRVYYNLGAWYGNLALLPFFGANSGAMERMMGVVEPLPEGLLPKIREGAAGRAWRMAGTGLGLLKAWWRLDPDVTAFHARMQAHLGPLEAEDLRHWDADRLAEAYRGLEREVLAHWRAPLSNDLFTMVFFGLLSKSLARWRPELPAGIVNDLLCAEPGIRSIEPLRALDRLCALALEDPERAKLFLAEEDLGRLWQALQADAAYSAALADYLKDYGSRCAGELKLETRILRDDPPALLGLLRPRVLQALRDGLTPARDEAAIRRKAEALVFAGLWPWKRFWLGWVLGQARRGIRHRENQRFERTRAFAVVRRIFQGIGRRLAEGGVLAAEADCYWLTKEELLGCLDGTAAQAGLKGLVALRQAEFEAYQAEAPPPDRFSTWGPLVLAPAEARPHEAVEGGLQGVGACPGVVRARVKVVHDPAQAGDLSGCILVAERTDPGWTLIFPACAGILVERGSLLSHSAIVARELGLPCVVAVPGLLASLKDGEVVEMDGSSGSIRRVEAS
jgi:pyruvate,water dikinase